MLKDLLEKRGRLVADMRAIAEKPEGAGGDLSDEQQRRFDAAKAELEAVERKIERQQLVDAAERRMRGQPLTEPETDDFARERRDFSLCRLIAATFDASVDAGREREICAEQRTRTGRRGEGYLVPFDCVAPGRRVENRVLTVAGDGANLVSNVVRGDLFIDALRPASVATRLGAVALTGLTADIALPRRDARTPGAAWFVENNAITAADQSFDQVAGSPKHLGLITEFGRKTMLQATPGIEELTRQHFMAELAAGLDLGVMKGTGLSGQPTGIAATASIGAKNNLSAAATWDDVLDVMATVEGADVPPASLGWALNAFAKAKFRATTKVASDAGAGFLMDDMGTLAGAPAAVTSQLAGEPTTPTDAEIIFGAWDQVIVAMWSGVEILVNPYESTAYSKGNVSVRGIVDADVLVRHPEAFVDWTGIALA